MMPGLSVTGTVVACRHRVSISINILGQGVRSFYKRAPLVGTARLDTLAVACWCPRAASAGSPLASGVVAPCLSGQWPDLPPPAASPGRVCGLPRPLVRAGAGCRDYEPPPRRYHQGHGPPPRPHLSFHPDPALSTGLVLRLLLSVSHAPRTPHGGGVDEDERGPVVGGTVSHAQAFPRALAAPRVLSARRQRTLFCPPAAEAAGRGPCLLQCALLPSLLRSTFSQPMAVAGTGSRWPRVTDRPSRGASRLPGR